MIELLISLFIFLGSAFILIAAIGIIRFGDLYSRMHATTKATSFGILLLIIGVSIFFNTGIVFLKAVLILVFIYLTAPLASHSIARSFRKNKDDQFKV
jgi:multicomponent Na+:H+ antiporter subunit G